MKIIKCKITASHHNSTMHENIRSVVYNLSIPDLVAMWNRYCKAIDDEANHIYEREEFNDVLRNELPVTIAEKASEGSWYWSDDYWKFNKEGSIDSFNWPIIDEADCIIYSDTIAEYCMHTDDDLGVPEIRSILDGNLIEEY